MAKRIVNYVCFREAVSAPAAGFGGESSLALGNKHKGLEMYTGMEPGFLTAICKGAQVGIPLANVKALVWAGVSDESKRND